MRAQYNVSTRTSTKLRSARAMLGIFLCKTVNLSPPLPHSVLYSFRLPVCTSCVCMSMCVCYRQDRGLLFSRQQPGEQSSPLSWKHSYKTKTASQSGVFPLSLGLIYDQKCSESYPPSSKKEKKKTHTHRTPLPTSKAHEACDFV